MDGRREKERARAQVEGDLIRYEHGSHTTTTTPFAQRSGLDRPGGCHALALYVYRIDEGGGLCRADVH